MVINLSVNVVKTDRRVNNSWLTQIPLYPPGECRGTPVPPGGDRTNMTWKDDDELTDPSEAQGPPALSKTLERAMPGDTITLEFQDDGDVIEGDYGKSVRFIVRAVESDVSLRTGDGDRVENGDEVAFITGSARLLSKLSEHDLEGKEVSITVTDTGMDAAYDVAVN